jgi:hypothetical protein
MVLVNKSFVKQLQVYMDELISIHSTSNCTDRLDELVCSVYRLINLNTDYNTNVRCNMLLPHWQKFNTVAQTRAIEYLKYTKNITSEETAQECRTFLNRQGINPLVKAWYPTNIPQEKKCKGVEKDSQASLWTRKNGRLVRRS